MYKGMWGLKPHFSRTGLLICLQGYPQQRFGSDDPHTGWESTWSGGTHTGRVPKGGSEPVQVHNGRGGVVNDEAPE